MDDPIGFLYETATYCRENDDKAPQLVGVSDFSTLTICPETGPADQVMGAVPEGWYARVMFDELLDPEVEELIPVDPADPDTTYTGSLLRTQPVTLTCAGVDVAYDGWYAPNGNNVTWPLGPSLVVTPLEFVATSATCSLMLKDIITDKDGNPVPMDQRGPFTWNIGALEVAATDPETGSEIAPDAQIVISFNAPLDPATVSEGSDVIITGPAAAGATVSAAGNDILIDPPGAGWTTGAYTVTVPTTATITDARGGMLTLAEDLVIDFTIP